MFSLSTIIIVRTIKSAAAKRCTSKTHTLDFSDGYETAILVGTSARILFFLDLWTEGKRVPNIKHRKMLFKFDTVEK
jgi:hypothetical protein